MDTLNSLRNVMAGLVPAMTTGREIRRQLSSNPLSPPSARQSSSTLTNATGPAP